MNKHFFFSILLLLACVALFSQSATVTLYDQCNYSGKKSYLTVGSYRGYQMQVKNDRLSSIKVPYGLKLTIYENDKFEGRSNTYTADQPCLEPDWRNMTSSIVIERDPAIPANASPYDGVTFFNDCYSKGYSQTLRPGNYTGGQLGQLKYNISSFSINGNLRIRIFMNSENLAGASAIYESSISCLTGNQNDNIGSLIIEYKPSPIYPSPGNGNNSGTGSRLYATLYADCNFNGNALRLLPGVYNGEQLGLLKYDISSIELAPNLKARVFINSEYTSGSSYTTVSSDINCMSGNMNDRIGALIIEETGYGQQQYPDEKVILYTDANYKGQSVSLGVGTWNTMEQAGFVNDGLSSIKIPAGYKVILYENPDASGNSTTLTASRNDLSSGFGNWNDKVSSITIYRD
jgi:hypothetical protein